jgi:hypothetical protein
MDIGEHIEKINSINKEIDEKAEEVASRENNRELWKTIYDDDIKNLSSEMAKIKWKGNPIKAKQIHELLLKRNADVDKKISLFKKEKEKEILQLMKERDEIREYLAKSKKENITKNFIYNSNISSIRRQIDKLKKLKEEIRYTDSKLTMKELISERNEIEKKMRKVKGRKSKTQQRDENREERSEERRRLDFLNAHIKELQENQDENEEREKNLERQKEELKKQLDFLYDAKEDIERGNYIFNSDNIVQDTVFDGPYTDETFENIKIGPSAQDRLFTFLSKDESSPSVVIPKPRFPYPDSGESRNWEKKFRKNNNLLDAVEDVRNYIKNIPTVPLHPKPFNGMEDFWNYIPSGEENPYELLKLYRNIDTKPSRDFKWKMLVKSLPQFGCSSCWSEYIKQRAFVEWLDQSRKWREYLYIIPNRDESFSTTDNKVERIFSEENFTVTFQMGEQFIALTLRDIFMLDFDFKDEISEKHIDNMLMYVVNLAHHAIGMKISFFKIRTDRGVHVFLLSDYADFTNMMWIDLMLKMCSDSWYVAFVNSRGWAIRLNGKKGKKGERVADPNIPSLSPPSLSSSFTSLFYPSPSLLSKSHLNKSIIFRSAYFGKIIELKFFTLEDITELVIGYKESINQKIFSMVVFHYLLIEYFRGIVGENAKDFGCQLFNKILGYEPQGNYTKDDVKELQKLIDESDSKDFFPLKHDSSLEKNSRKYVRIDPVYENEIEQNSTEELDYLNDRYEREMQTIEGLRDDIKIIYNYTMNYQNYLVYSTKLREKQRYYLKREIIISPPQPPTPPPQPQHQEKQDGPSSSGIYIPTEDELIEDDQAYIDIERQMFEEWRQMHGE